MTLMLMAFITFLIFLVAYNTLGKDVMSPTFLLVAGYLLSFVSTLYNIKDWKVSIGFLTMTVFLLGMLSFFVGEYVVKRRTATARSQSMPIEIEYIDIDKWKYVVVVVSCTVILVLTYREVVRIANLNFASWGNLAYNFKANSMNADLEGAGLSSFVQQINKITKGFAYAFLFVFVNNIFAQKTKTERIANFANLIPGVLFSAQCILKGGRFPVVAFIIGAFFLYYYFWRRTKGWGKVIPVKYIVRIVLIIAGVIAAFWFSKELVGRLSKDNDLMGYVTRYFGGGPVLFELYLKDSSMLHDAPNETFAGLISSLNKFGFNLTGRAYHEFRAASGITIGNAYSALRNYYHDYSIFGVILFNYILAFVFSIKYYDLKYCSDITYKKAFSLTLYASFIYTVFFQFFTDYFFARLSVGLFIEVIVLRICFWFVMRLKVCFGRR